jgi:hypothetical protein
MNKVLVAGTAALTLSLANPLMAQSTATGTDLAGAQAQIEALKQQLERLEATVDYLKANASAERKDAAQAAVDVGTLKSASDKFTWSGDFRFRHEIIDQAVDNNSDAHARQRDRVRVRFGVLAKVNDDISFKLQLSTVGTGSDSTRSRNQTLGNDWNSESIGLDLMYADWKMNALSHLILGKQPMPWTTTASYFWDKDLTPEGAALKWARGPWFANASYMWLNERNIGGNQGASTDATMAGTQLGLRQSLGNNTLTLAAAYYDLAGVQGQVVKYSSTSIASAGGGPVVTSTCTIDGAFGAGAGTGDNSFGNTTYTGPAPQLGSAAPCTRLLSDFNVWSALLQWDTSFGRFPFTVFADYMKNANAKVNPKVDKTLDTATAFGFTFNKASAPRSWEFGALYEQNQKDGVFGQFVDSDFAGGVTDAKGWTFKGAYVLASNWTFNLAYFLNKLNYGGVPITDSKHDQDYKRLQLDLNYKY